MGNIKKVLEYMDEGMSECEAYRSVSLDMELSKSFHLRILSMLEQSDGFINISEIVTKFNSYEHIKFRMTEKKVILEVLKYPNYFYYTNGLIIDIKEDTFYKIKKYHSYIKNLLKPYFNPSDIQYIVSFLFFLKRASDINLFDFNYKQLCEFIFFNDHKETLISQLESLENIPFNIIGDFINYIKDLDENIYTEISNIINLIDLRDYSTTIFGKIFELLIDRSLEHNYTNKSMQKLMVQLSGINGTNTILNPFGSLGGLIAETIQHDSNNDVKYNHNIYQDMNNRTLQLAFMTICMYGNSRVEFTNIDSLDTYSDNIKYDYIITELPLSKKFTQSKLSSPTIQNIVYNNSIGEIKSKDSILYYILYILSKINENGKAIFNVPSGFLFSSNLAYKKIRQELIENDLIESIINLPAGTMYHSGINTAILIINKNKRNHLKNKIKIINANLLYRARTKNREILNESILDIEAILEANNGETKDSVIVNIDDISKTDYSLDANKFKREVLELQNSLKDGTSKYLRELSMIKKGKKFDKNKLSDNKGFPIVKIQNLHNNIVDIYLKDDDTFEMLLDVPSRDIISEECLLIASVGGQIKPTIYRPTNKLPNIFTTTNIIALIPRENMSIEYLYYQIYSKIISEQIKNMTLGSIRTFLTIKNFAELIVPYVELKEQNNYINTQKSSIMAEQRAELEAKLELMGYKEELESKESDIVRTLTHQLRPVLSNLFFEVENLKDIIKSNNIQHLVDNDIKISDDPDAKRMEINTLEQVTSIIYEDSKKLHDSLNTVDKIMKFKLESKDFTTNDLYSFMNDYKNRQHKDYEINLKGYSTQVDFNKKSLIELLDQLLRNAEEHAFLDNEKYKISFNIKENKKKNIVIIEYFNNGKKFEVSREMYINAFRKDKNSNGSGIGGNFIYRIIKAHNGEIFIQDSSEGFKFYIELPKKQSWESE